ncbi:glutathione S-transferase family protein [Egbenema bharatensis]|uniref:glutathione S-transferase family protein n=1 Tax=Egbenema bharatensis TaxID=3463334 RepID=UPI003A87EB77
MAPFTLIIGNKNYSSWSLRAWLTLKQSGIPFEEIRIPLDQPNTRSQLLQHSPSGLVPVLKHGSLTLWESLAICEYIAEQAPDRLLYPAGMEERAVARSVSAEMHAGFAALRQYLPMDCRSRISKHPIPDNVQAEIDRVLELWRMCRQEFGEGGEFLFGQFSIPDAMFAPVVTRFITYDVAMDDVSQAYAASILSLPAMQEWLTAAAAEVEVIDDP